MALGAGAVHDPVADVPLHSAVYITTDFWERMITSQPRDKQ